MMFREATCSQSAVWSFLHHLSLSQRQPSLGTDSTVLITVRFALCVTTQLSVTVLGQWHFFISIISFDPAKLQNIFILPQNSILILSCHNGRKMLQSHPWRPQYCACWGETCSGCAMHAGSLLTLSFVEVS